MKHICASILVVALIAAVADAQTVRQVPSDNYPTIQAAITAAQANDTVRVAPGTYVENINFLGKAIAVVSIAGPDVTIIDGNAAGPVVSFTTNEGLNSVLEGFTLRNGKVTSLDGGGIRISAASPTVRRNQIVNNSACGIAINSGSPLIQGNVIRDNTSGGCTTGGGGILVIGAGSAQILDNTISNNTASRGGGISLWAAGTPLIRGNIITGNTGNDGGGISMSNFSDAKIIQNVIAGNTASRGGGIYWLVPGGGQHGPSILSNSIVDNNASQQGSGIYADGFDGFTPVRNNLIIGKTGQPAIYCGNFNDSNPPILEFNNVFTAQAAGYSGFCSDVTGTNGNISAAPLFTNSAAGDFRLIAGSPGINVGNNGVPDLPTLDLDSVRRILPSGGAVDMGAYEFAAPTTSTISPSTLTFPDQAAGTVSAPLEVTLTNTGSEILVVRSITLNGEFSQSNTCQTASGIGAGQSCAISIRFAPSAGGPRSGQLTVSGNWGAGNTVTLSGNGLADLSLSTTPIAFSDQRVGSLSAATTVTVSNTGTGALDISSITTTGNFTSSSDCPASLPASSTCSISVQFGPLARGTQYGAVTITSSATASPHVVLLSGNGIAPTITLTPSSLSFPSVAIGGTSAPLTVTVSNQGDQPLLISSISATAPYSQTHDCGASLAVSQTCTISVVFNPTTFATVPGTVTVANDAIGSPHTVTLTGTGTGSFLSANPTSVAFGNQGINTTSASRMVTLTNTGNTALLPTITVSPDFIRSSSTCGVLNAFASCTVFVSFRPTSLGAKAGALTITSTAIGSPLMVPLSGTGVDAVFSPSTLSFGAVRVGTTKTLSATFANNSPNPISIQSISATASFSQQNNCGVILAPGVSCLVDVTFAPGSAGVFSGTLSITDDAIGSPHVLPLTGTGGVGNVLLSVNTPLQFGSSLVGTPSLPLALTLSNNGSAPLTISSITTSEDFTQTNNCVNPVAMGTSCSINIRFVPVAAGPRNGTLTIVNDGAGTPNSAVLLGTGVGTLPVPVITSLSPDSRVVGAAGVTVTVTGSGFFPQSVVRWDGNDRPTTFVNNTSLTTTIPAGDFAAMKTFPVTVFNPGPDGGRSNRIGFVVYLPVTLTTKNLIYDRLGDRIYASVPANAPARANTLTPIDPYSGTLGNSLSIGSDPNKLAISDDSRVIYVGFDGMPQVRRFDTVTQTPGNSFALGSDSFSGPFYAEDIAVAPGNPDTIAVSRRVLGISPKHVGVAIYDNGTKRPVETATHTGSNVIEFSASPGELYGYNNESTEFGFRRMSVSPSGVTVISVVTSFDRDLIAGFGTDIHFAGGRIYTTTGRVIEPVVGTRIATLPLPGNINDQRGVVVDVAMKRAFYLVATATSVRILAFDTETFAQTSSITLPAQGMNFTMGNLIRWGRNGLAFRTANQVLVFEIPENWLERKPSRDFNADSKSDILWQSTDGSSAIWLMDGISLVSGGGLLGPATGWSVNRVGDFNGDAKGDLVWEHADGSSTIWLMNGATLVSGGGLLGPGTGWSVKTLGDFNGDGSSDIVWQHTDGSTSVWQMNGLSLTASAGWLGPGTGWSVKTVGDFNGDGKSDIVWQNVDGSTAAWEMNGLTLNAGAGWLGPGTGWSVKAIGDFNGDGNSDIVWQHTDGSTSAWQMNGLSLTAGAGWLGPGTGWSVKTVGDFNGDGKSDVVWQHTDGSTSAWQMNGLSLSAGAGFLGPATGWSVKTTGDFNADGKTDIVWQHTDGSTSMWLMNGLSLSSGGGLLGSGTGWSPAP